MYYPIMIELDHKKVVVFGGGRVAYRKCEAILKCGAKVSIISKEFIEDFYLLEKKYSDFCILIKDKYQQEYIHDCYLVVAATSSNQTNQEISQCCKQRKILCNVVNSLEKCDYIVPSMVRRGDLLISVSTSGKSPFLSQKIKKELEKKYPQEYEEYLNFLGQIRNKVLQTNKTQEEKRKILKEILNFSLEELKEWM
ncbi:precorrin-2 dehydrogenase/sirohydrochlorin ferrochelatase family protein [Garciella nitratireducens]|uniref:precorrin-2 dehydrogenase n=1 Tax=Garciella nitratireducens DSM 15102 TaxID=1121911 RepID=A0A1T4KJ15_9FIRM|nr:bifunctional precorrin-2 dehydrogenase/sirohydrochlorin ferrochelatase [Garciella nitratireducens]RBP41571.1 precorrin-2 dehydrogenase/sirohydrochlorin ferrochelatase [Garciella nitratireducens]SJZ42394.1 precorrin-2 dehydrogenase / sirohydrochlorin ferrochelatase [Garciella nitratireducens DSM 15102]